MVTNTGHIGVDETTATRPNGLTLRLLDGDRPVGTFGEDQEYLQ